LGEIGRIDSVVNESVSFIPFLVVVLLVMVMGRVDREVANKSLSIFFRGDSRGFYAYSQF